MFKVLCKHYFDRILTVNLCNRSELLSQIASLLSSRHRRFELRILQIMNQCSSHLWLSLCKVCIVFSCYLYPNLLTYFKWECHYSRGTNSPYCCSPKATFFEQEYGAWTKQCLHIFPHADRGSPLQMFWTRYLVTLDSRDEHFPEPAQNSIPDFAQLRLMNWGSRTMPPSKQLLSAWVQVLRVPCGLCHFWVASDTPCGASIIS